MLRPFRIICLPILCSLACLVAAGPASATTLPAGFAENTIASPPASADPVAVTWAPDGRLFIADRQGRVYVHNPGDPPSTTQLVLDIQSTVTYAATADRGLMDIATDVNFASNHILYLLYTVGSDDTGPKVSTLTRVTVNPDNSVVGGVNNTGDILLGSERTLQPTSSPNGVCGTVSNTHDCIPSEGTSHSVGTVRSAPDGTLFVGTGDGNDFHKVDPLAANDDNPATFRGKLMHIDRNGNGVPGHPFCPGNPLTDVCTKIFAVGVRQPFRFTLRPEGGVAFGDVGENDFEEFDLANGGEDFGWPCFEGTGPTPFQDSMGNKYSDWSQCTAKYGNDHTTKPALSYPHVSYPVDPADCHNAASGNAVIGGPTYMGNQYPAGYRGTIFFGDFVCGWLSRASVSGNTVTGTSDFSDDWKGVDLESAPDGNLVYVDSGSGQVREIVYLPGNHAPTVSASVSPKTGVAPLSVNFSSTGADPDSDPITYDWDFGDGSPHSSAQNPSHVYSKAANWVATVTVSDNRGMSTSASVPVPVTTTGGGGSKPKIKVLALTLSASSARLAARGILRGSFRSSNSVRSVNVSLWRGRVGSGAAARTCRFWSRRSHKLKRGSCAQPHWMRATLHRKGNRYTWTVKLGAKLPRGSYTVVVRAWPRSSKLAPSTPKRLKLRVRR
jgi:glucose/arabinose dehydrogenase